MSAQDRFPEVLALRAALRFDEALALLEELAARYPDDYQPQHNRALLLIQMGRPAEAEAPARAGVALAPESVETRYALAVSLLMQGRYEEAWPLYEARLETTRIPVPRGFPFPRWNGEALAGRHIAIFPEQGFGDQIQFARFVPRIEAQGAEVTLLTRPALVDLFRASFPATRILPAEGSVDFPDPDYWAMSLDMARIAGATVGTLPQPPYLIADRPAPVLAPGFRIGLMTKGNPNYAQDGSRSLPAAIADELREALPGSIVDLDPAATGASSFADTAAIVRECDLVIAVDTAVVHLAGALDRPCFALIQGFGADWRWMAGREDSPWYPRTRLFRAGLDMDWRPAVRRVIDAANVMAGAFPSTSPLAPR